MKALSTSQFVDFSFAKEGNNDNTTKNTSLCNYWGEHCNKYLKFNDIGIPIAEALFIHMYVIISTWVS